jgi:hypothetical protein
MFNWAVTLNATVTARYSDSCGCCESVMTADGLVGLALPIQFLNLRGRPAAAADVPRRLDS